jgi:hypothetical protein
MVELVVFRGSPRVELMVFRGSPTLNHGSHIGIFLGTSSTRLFDHTSRTSTDRIRPMSARHVFFRAVYEKCAGIAVISPRYVAEHNTRQGASCSTSTYHPHALAIVLSFPVFHKILFVICRTVRRG